MKYVELIFSPTGGTQKVADAITSVWNNEVQKEDLTDVTKAFSSVNIEQDDLVLIAVPSFGGRVPAIAAQRLSQIKGNGAKCVIVCTYGNRAYEDTLIELRDIAASSNFSVIAAIAAIAEHSIIHQYAAGRPNQEDIEKLQNFSNKILEKFNDKNAAKTPISIPGNVPYKKAGAGGLVPKANSDCTNCGLCAEKCPVQAIDKNKLKTANSKKCISCMRCISICPQNARHADRIMISAAALAIKKACSIEKECELFI